MLGLAIHRAVRVCGRCRDIRTVRGHLSPLRSTSSLSQARLRRRHRPPQRRGRYMMLQIAGITLLLTVLASGSLLLLWPMMDGFILPWVVKRAILNSKARPLRHPPPDVEVDAATALRRYLDEAEAREGRPCLVVLTGEPDHVNTIGEVLAQEGPGLYVNLLGGCDIRVLLYSFLSQMLATMEVSGGLLQAYIKGVNVLGDLATGNQHHEHTTYIFFNLFLGVLRSGLWRIKDEGTHRIPVIVFSSMDEVVRGLRLDAPGAKNFSLSVETFRRVTELMCCEEQLAHIVFTGRAAEMLTSKIRSDDPPAVTHFSEAVLKRSVKFHVPPSQAELHPAEHKKIDMKEFRKYHVAEDKAAAITRMDSGTLESFVRCGVLEPVMGTRLTAGLPTANASARPTPSVVEYIEGPHYTAYSKIL